MFAENAGVLDLVLGVKKHSSEAICLRLHHEFSGPFPEMPTLPGNMAFSWGTIKGQ